jgi:hypothetical protein
MKFFVTIILIILSKLTLAQSDDLSRITLNPFVSQTLSLPDEAESQLLNKLSVIATNYGMSGNQYNPRFVITANVNVISKDIIPGPPNMFAEKIDLTLFIGDGIDNVLFTSLTIPLKGVGTNENKAFIDAFNNIKTKSTEIQNFINNGTAKIINYYSSKCDFIIKNAESLANQERYDEGIYNLSIVPDVIKDCYIKCKDKLAVFFKQKIDADCKQKLNKARAIWTSSQNSSAAQEAGQILLTVNQGSICVEEVKNLFAEMNIKVAADQQAVWQFKVRQYEDHVQKEKELMQYAREDANRSYELSKLQTEACRQVAVEWARNQPKTVNYTSNYNRIMWW